MHGDDLIEKSAVEVVGNLAIPGRGGAMTGVRMRLDHGDWLQVSLDDPLVVTSRGEHLVEIRLQEHRWPEPGPAVNARLSILAERALNLALKWQSVCHMTLHWWQRTFPLLRAGPVASRGIAGHCRQTIEREIPGGRR